MSAHLRLVRPPRDGEEDRPQRGGGVRARPSAPIRPSDRLPPQAYAEWLQMEVAAREDERRRERRWILAIVATLGFGGVLALRALWALSS